MRTHFLIPVALFLFALVLRLRGLSEISFWYDELWTASLWAAPNTITEVWGRLWLSAEGNLPLYPIFINLWTKVFGTNDYSLIAPSILAGAAAVSVLYVLASKIFSKTEGIVAGLLMSTLSTPLYFSQEARSYSLILLLVCLNLLYRFEQKKWGWVIASILLCWIHYFGIFFVFMQLLPDLFKNRKNLIWYLFPVLSLLPILNLIIYQIGHGPSFRTNKSLHKFFAWVLDTESSLAFYGLSLILIIQTGYILFSKKKWKEVSAELIFYFYAPYLFLITYNYFKPIYSSRYLITLIPPAILLIAQFMGRFKFLTPLLILTSWSAVITDIRQYSRFPRFKAALEYIETKNLGTNILFVPSHYYPPLTYYLNDLKKINVISTHPEQDNYLYIDLGSYKTEKPFGLYISDGAEVDYIDVDRTRIYQIKKKLD